MKRLSKFIALALCATLLVSCAPSDSYIRHRVVKLTNDSRKGSCSGEQVRAPSGLDYILTAAHCRGLADKDGSIVVITEKNKELRRKIIAEDSEADLLLLEGLPNIKGLEIAKSNYRGQSVRTFTHGGGRDTYTTEGMMIQSERVTVPIFIINSQEDSTQCSSKPKYVEIDAYIFKMCILSVDMFASTAGIIPGSSGGAALDYKGRLIGVASAGDSSGTSYWVGVKDIKRFLSGY